MSWRNEPGRESGKERKGGRGETGCEVRIGRGGGWRGRRGETDCEVGIGRGVKGRDERLALKGMLGRESW